MFCSNCGAEIEDALNHCPYCGKFFVNNNLIKEKDNKIKELERKILDLEQRYDKDDNGKNKERMPIFMIVFAFLFFFCFLLFFTIMVIFR